MVYKFKKVFFNIILRQLFGFSVNFILKKLRTLFVIKLQKQINKPCASETKPRIKNNETVLRHIFLSVVTILFNLNTIFKKNL